MNKEVKRMQVVEQDKEEMIGRYHINRAVSTRGAVRVGSARLTFCCQKRS